MLTLFLTATIFASFTKFYDNVFLVFNERREDKVAIRDIVLDTLPTKNTQHIITTFSNLNILVICIEYMGSSNRAQLLIQMMCCFMACGSLRMLCMFVCPFKIHPRALVLHDTFVERFTCHIKPYKHDLMFSGHISFLTQVYTVCLNHKDRYMLDNYLYLYYICSLTMVSGCMLLGKYHYTIDLIVSPFLSKTCCDWVLNLIDA